MSEFWKDIRFLVGRRDAWRLAALAAILSVESFLEVASLISFPLFASLLLAGGEIPADEAGRLYCAVLGRFFGCSAPATRLLCAGAVVVGIYLLLTLWSLIGLALQYRFLGNRRNEFSTRLLRGYLYVPSPSLEATNSSDLMNLLIVECNNVVEGVFNPIIEFFRAGFNTLCIVAMLFWWTPGMTTAALVLMGVTCTGVMAFRNRALHRFSQEEQRGREMTMRTGSEALDARTEAAIYGCREFFLARFHKNMETLATAQAQNMCLQRETWPVLGLLSITSFFAILLGALILCHGTPATVLPALALLAMTLIRLRSHAVNIMQNLLQFRRFLPSLALLCAELRRLEKIHTTLSGSADSQDGTPIRPNSIRLDKVSYAYPGNSTMLLDGISTEIPFGESVAIVGSTGCGKTTLLQLLLGLLPPSRGKILLDGIPMESRLKAWRHSIGYVSQTPFLMDGTIEDNIALGISPEDRSSQALEHAIRLAQLTDTLAQFPQGLQTPMGEAGRRLSGGQRQRVILARALYRSPAVLVFDEATSALDRQTEANVTTALESLHGKVTMLTVTHHLESLHLFDRILFLKNGRLEAQGTYAQLFENSQPFREFITEK